MIEVSAGIVCRDDKLLLAKRHFHQHQGDRWEFPGGKLEDGETAFRALQREMKEEVDLAILAADKFTTLEYLYPDKDVRLHFFIVTSFAGEPCHQEGQELRWVLISELGKYEFPDANRPVVELLEKFKFCSI